MQKYPRRIVPQMTVLQEISRAWHTRTRRKDKPIFQLPKELLLARWQE